MNWFIQKPVNWFSMEVTTSDVVLESLMVKTDSCYNLLFSLLTLNMCLCIYHLERKLQLAFNFLSNGKMNPFRPESPCSLSASGILKNIEINGIIDTNLINPFLANVPILYTLKTTENQKFVVFSGVVK